MFFSYKSQIRILIKLDYKYCKVYLKLKIYIKYKYKVAAQKIVIFEDWKGKRGKVPFKESFPIFG